MADNSVSYNGDLQTYLMFVYHLSQKKTMMRLYACVSICLYIFTDYISIYIYTHTHTHTHTYIYILKETFSKILLSDIWVLSHCFNSTEKYGSGLFCGLGVCMHARF